MAKLIHIANVRIPTERAHGLQIAKMCEAFAQEGLDVTLLLPNKRNKLTEDPFRFYSITKNFKIVKINVPNLVRFGPTGYYLSSWLFAILAAREVAGRNFDLIFSREGNILWLLSFLVKAPRLIWEVHDDQRKWWSKRVLRKVDLLVTTNRALANLLTHFISRKLVPLVLPNGVSLSEYDYSRNRIQFRQSLGIPADSQLIVYAGHLYDYKGVDTLIKAVSRLPHRELFLIGGTVEDLERLRSRHHSSNIKILGRVAHKSVAQYLQAADLLVIPNTALDRFSTLYTSPIKLFEYLASGTPILASDLPSIREIVGDDEVFFFTPDDQYDLESKVEAIFADPVLAKSKASASLLKSKQFTWQNRAKSILALVRTRRLPRLKNPFFVFVRHPLSLLYWRIFRKLRAYTCVNYDILWQMRTIIHQLDRQAIPGSIVEVGCWRGGCGAFMALVSRGRETFLYDSFNPFPPFGQEDGSYVKKLNLEVASEIDVEEISSQLGVRPIVMKGFIKDAFGLDNPIALLRLDVDLYQSTFDALEKFYDQVSPGGCVVIDDFEFPGCRAAVEKFLLSRGTNPKIHPYGRFNNAYFIKP